jgi:hypothetical protein
VECSYRVTRESHLVQWGSEGMGDGAPLSRKE